MAAPTLGDRAGTLRRARVVLAGGGFRRLLATRLSSQVGDGLFQVAAADVLIFRDPSDNPAWDVTKLSAAVLIPFSVVVPFLGVFIDRWDRRQILVWVPIVRAAIAALLPLAAAEDPRSPWVYAIVILVLSANRLLLATISAVTPQLVATDQLIVANSIATTGGSIMTLVGWGVGAAGAELLGANTPAGLAVGAFAVAAAFGAGVPVWRARIVGDGIAAALAAVAREMVAGIRAVRAQPPVLYALTAIIAMQVLIGAVVAASVVTFIQRFDAGVASYSTLLAVTAVGVFVGVLTVPAAERRVPKEHLIAAAFAVAGFAAATAAPSLNRVGLTLATFAIGLSFAYAKIPVDTIVQERMRDVFRGRAFASYDVLYNVARAAGLAAAAAAIEAGATDKAVVAGAAVGAILVAMGLRFWSRRVRRPAEQQPPIVLPAGEIVTVRAYSGYRAEEEPRAVVVGGRELPIEAIDWRAVEERDGDRRRVFVVRLAGQRVRLAYSEGSSSWVVDRVL